MIEPIKDGIEIPVLEALSPKVGVGIFSRFVERMINPFSSSGNVMKSSASLEGRIDGNVIHSHKKMTQLNDRLQQMSLKFEKNLDDELIGYVKIAMKLITRDYERIQKQADQVLVPEENKAYGVWISKAERWIELGGQLHNRTAVIDTVIQDFFINLVEHIEQDLRLIVDYKADRLKKLDLSTQQKKELQKTLQKKIKPFMQAFIQLKEPPEGLELHKVFEWKGKVNDRRASLFEKALLSIEKTIAETSPNQVENDVEESREELMPIISEMNALECAVIELLQQTLPVIVDVDDTTRKTFMATLTSLQKHAHLLNSNLLLTSKLFDQLQMIQKHLVQVKSIIAG